MPSFNELMLSALGDRRKPADFNEAVTRFYDQWFVQEGTSYYVLFKKNLRITNLQFAELISLLRCHIVSEKDASLSDPLFVSADEFKGFLTELLADTLPSLEVGTEYQRDHILPLTEQYEGILQRVVVLNPYFGSCTIYLPPGLTLVADKLCAESGYIHSLGRLVYVRNMTKATENELIEVIEKHLERYPLQTDIPALFRVYSHEDFTLWDRWVGNDTPDQGEFSKRTYASDLSYGLDEVKIQTRKAYFKRTNIIEVIRRLSSKFGKQLEIPAPGSFKKTLEEFEKKYRQKPERTFFLLNDAGVQSNSSHPNQKKFYVCYDQLWYNHNPFYVFDEDKPAWFSHTTIPHSMAAAMINITRPWQKDKISLIDPFGGSGTMLLEALKHPEISAVSGVEELANIVARDNVSLFKKSHEEVLSLRDFLKQYLEQDHVLKALDATELNPGIHRDFVVAKKEYDEALKASKMDNNSDLGLERARSVRSLSENQRLVFYLLLRTRMRHSPELQEGRTHWSTAFMEELRNLIQRLNSHIDFLHFSKRGSLTERGVPHAIGDYSKVCWLSLDIPRSGLDQFLIIRDATQLEENTYDLIVTDPPYGFNTQEADIKLIKLYREFIWAAVAALRDGGQLVICCPHYSYSGRHVPIFIQPEFVTQQVLLAARDHDKAVHTEQHSLPAELDGLRPPFYWEAPTALQRSILHFRFASNNNRNRSPPAKE
jgi:tRNA G10  N-methylase Trm11